MSAHSRNKSPPDNGTTGATTSPKAFETVLRAWATRQEAIAPGFFSDSEQECEVTVEPNEDNTSEHEETDGAAASAASPQPSLSSAHVMIEERVLGGGGYGEIHCMTVWEPLVHPSPPRKPIGIDGPLGTSPWWKDPREIYELGMAVQRNVQAMTQNYGSPLVASAVQHVVSHGGRRSWNRVDRVAVKVAAVHCSAVDCMRLRGEPPHTYLQRCEVVRERFNKVYATQRAGAAAGLLAGGSSADKPMDSMHLDDLRRIMQKLQMRAHPSDTARIFTEVEVGGQIATTGNPHLHGIERVVVYPIREHTDVDDNGMMTAGVVGQVSRKMDMDLRVFLFHTERRDPCPTPGAGFLERRTCPACCLHVAAATIDGIAELHARGVMHRDIKPMNILVNRGAGAAGSAGSAVRLSSAFGGSSSASPPNEPMAPFAAGFGLLRPEDHNIPHCKSDASLPLTELQHQTYQSFVERSSRPKPLSMGGLEAERGRHPPLSPTFQCLDGCVPVAAVRICDFNLCAPIHAQHPCRSCCPTTHATPNTGLQRGAWRCGGCKAPKGVGQPTGQWVPLSQSVMTPTYRAPELEVPGAPYGPGIDVWGYGCVVGELLNAGRVLFPEIPAEQQSFDVDRHLHHLALMSHDVTEARRLVLAWIEKCDPVNMALLWPTGSTLPPLGAHLRHHRLGRSAPHVAIARALDHAATRAPTTRFERLRRTRLSGPVVDAAPSSLAMGTLWMRRYSAPTHDVCIRIAADARQQPSQPHTAPSSPNDSHSQPPPTGQWSALRTRLRLAIQRHRRRTTTTTPIPPPVTQTTARATPQTSDPSRQLGQRLQATARHALAFVARCCEQARCGHCPDGVHTVVLARTTLMLLDVCLWCLTLDPGARPSAENIAHHISRFQLYHARTWSSMINPTACAPPPVPESGLVPCSCRECQASTCPTRTDRNNLVPFRLTDYSQLQPITRAAHAVRYKMLYPDQIGLDASVVSLPSLSFTSQHEHGVLHRSVCVDEAVGEPSLTRALLGSLEQLHIPYEIVGNDHPIVTKTLTPARADAESHLRAGPPYFL